jgi:hypothetical protein
MAAAFNGEREESRRRSGRRRRRRRRRRKQYNGFAILRAHFVPMGRRYVILVWTSTHPSSSETLYSRRGRKRIMGRIHQFY